jgi:8-oxo-dGTP pyrophosphatase MutT (NUDIX family)
VPTGPVDELPHDLPHELPHDLPHDEANPWRQLATQTVYSNPWITVTHDEVLRPDGNPGIYGVVHYANRAVAIVPIADDDTTWLVGQYRYTVDRYSWEVPEGGVPFDEDLAVGARRELQEETGLTALDVEHLGVFNLSNSTTDEEAHVFVAWGLTEGEANPEGTEQLRQVRVPFTNVMERVHDGTITDSLSVLALIRVEEWRARRLKAVEGG